MKVTLVCESSAVEPDHVHVCRVQAVPHRGDMVVIDDVPWKVFHIVHHIRPHDEPDIRVVVRPYK